MTKEIIIDLTENQVEEKKIILAGLYTEAQSAGHLKKEYAEKEKKILRQVEKLSTETKFKKAEITVEIDFNEPYNGKKTIRNAEYNYLNIEDMDDYEINKYPPTLFQTKRKNNNIDCDTVTNVISKGLQKIADESNGEIEYVDKNEIIIDLDKKGLSKPYANSDHISYTPYIKSPNENPSESPYFNIKDIVEFYPVSDEENIKKVNTEKKIGLIKNINAFSSSLRPNYIRYRYDIELHNDKTVIFNNIDENLVIAKYETTEEALLALKKPF